MMDLPKMERGNKHVLVFHDFLSKWPMVFPIPDQKAERIAKLLISRRAGTFLWCTRSAPLRQGNKSVVQLNERC